MKNIFITLVLLILIGCHNPSAPIVNEMSPVTEADLSSGVLYEANIRQYSPEGTFNAFAKVDKRRHLLREFFPKLLHRDLSKQQGFLVDIAGNNRLCF